MSQYIMEPGAELEVSNSGRLYEKLGQTQDAAKSGLLTVGFMVAGITVIGLMLMKPLKRR